MTTRSLRPTPAAALPRRAARAPAVAVRAAARQIQVRGAVKCATRDGEGPRDRPRAAPGAGRVARPRPTSLPLSSAQVEVDKPLNINFAPSKAAGGGLVVKSVGGNAAKAGIAAGDTVVMTSSFVRRGRGERIGRVWRRGTTDRSRRAPPLPPPTQQFGEELWPADNLAFTKSALANAPSPVVLVYVKGENKDVNVKRLVKKPAPQRFGRKLNAAQKALATHICVDCGYIYCAQAPFESLNADYRCPQCNAPRKRFARYDSETGKVKGGSPDALATNLTVVGGLVGVGVLAYLGLTL